ncbi:hypothetical protein Mp_3g18730 [Marchantia polymorpha subsp. ruderalis]|uniref:Uncharacterized protein n=2 Tax=Marchantia polymorpha TaxID=3197 RepID=A0AAF6B2A8_MARPO|nr:hypothetical protein MARPO_0142s0021 [Marchantia polymorpha]BBN06142.1 hypothetical protein Mp_3g18730 [Marchantia polymorpha subsp. ruderalis]|eukprot:PTQ29391.1 hypothetical protein MARPO_0142s0021 [Marchantia polymorpha]
MDHSVDTWIPALTCMYCFVDLGEYVCRLDMTFPVAESFVTRTWQFLLFLSKPTTEADTDSRHLTGSEYDIASVMDSVSVHNHGRYDEWCNTFNGMFSYMS